MSGRTQLESGACQAGLEGRLIASLLPPPKFFCAGRLFLNAASITPNRAVALKQGTHPPEVHPLSQRATGKGSFLSFFFMPSSKHSDGIMGRIFWVYECVYKGTQSTPFPLPVAKGTLCADSLPLRLWWF